MTLTDQDRKADTIIKNACDKMEAATNNAIPLFVTPWIIAWHWTDMLQGIALCYDATFDESSVRDILRNKRVVLAYIVGYGGLISLAQKAQKNYELGNISSKLSAGLTQSLGMIYKQCWREGRNPTVDEVVKALTQVKSSF
jgi:hypothetical protein